MPPYNSSTRSTSDAYEAFMEEARREYGSKLDVSAIQSRVFIYDWFKFDVPSSEDFEVAVAWSKTALKK